MGEVVVGYLVRVQDCSPDKWDKNAKILHQQEFLARQEDMEGYRLGEALRRAEQHAQHMEDLWEDRYVEVEPIWRERKEGEIW